LGVHEHWNNAVNKQYSRNLGAGDGIELVDGAVAAGKVGDFNGDDIVNFEDFAFFGRAWGSSIMTSNYNIECDLDVPKNNIIDVRDLMVFADHWLD